MTSPFRRWFITKAFEGLERGTQGYNAYAIKETVGHKIMDITAGTYRGTSGIEARRAFVAAVGCRLAFSHYAGLQMQHGFA